MNAPFTQSLLYKTAVLYCRAAQTVPSIDGLPRRVCAKPCIDILTKILFLRWRATMVIYWWVDEMGRCVVGHPQSHVNFVPHDVVPKMMVGALVCTAMGVISN